MSSGLRHHVSCRCSALLAALSRARLLLDWPLPQQQQTQSGARERAHSSLCVACPIASTREDAGPAIAPRFYSAAWSDSLFPRLAASPRARWRRLLAFPRACHAPRLSYELRHVSRPRPPHPIHARAHREGAQQPSATRPDFPGTKGSSLARGTQQRQQQQGLDHPAAALVCSIEQSRQATKSSSSKRPWHW